MREILFRGKTISDGRWVIGGIVPAFHPNFDNKDIEKFTAGTANTYAICDEKKDYFVDIETIGQFTGLTDKNGRRIFEGDIVMSDYFLLSNPNQKKAMALSDTERLIAAAAMAFMAGISEKKTLEITRIMLSSGISMIILNCFYQPLQIEAPARAYRACV